jgi:hypothetical protein
MVQVDRKGDMRKGGGQGFAIRIGGNDKVGTERRSSTCLQRELDVGEKTSKAMRGEAA